MSLHSPCTPPHALSTPPHLSHTPLSSHCSAPHQPPSVRSRVLAPICPLPPPSMFLAADSLPSCTVESCHPLLTAHGWLDTDLRGAMVHALPLVYLQLTVHPHALTVFRNEPGWLTERCHVHACLVTGKTSRNRDTCTITSQL